jgi:hypothetical protein
MELLTISFFIAAPSLAVASGFVLCSRWRDRHPQSG